MSEAQDVAQNWDSVSPAPQTPGRLLREAREAAGLSVEDVAKVTKFATRQIKALEADDYAVLPGATFVRGLVRSYARHLRLSEASLLAALDAVVPAALPDVREPSNMGPVAPKGEHGPTVLTAMAIVLSIAALLIGAWHFFGDRVPSALSQRRVEAVPATAAVSPVAPVADGKSTVAPGNAAVPAPPVAPHAAVSAPAAAVMPAAPAVAATVPLPAVSPVAETASPGDDLRRLTFVFRDRAWIEVRDANQKVVLAGEQPAGARQTLSGRPPLHLVIGNAAQVDLFDGQRRIDLTPHTRAEVARLRLD